MSFYIPSNEFIKESGYFALNEISELLRMYKEDSEAISFIADMIEQ